MTSQKESVELKACPFCGETPDDPVDGIDGWSRLIHRCRVVGPIVLESASTNRTTTLWNTRTQKETT